MNRLIDIENEFQQYKPFRGCEHAMYRKICEAEIAIGKTQAADVAPVRHGRWVHTDLASHWHGKDECSECTYHEHDRRDLSHFRYCPNCGAKMDGGTD